MKFKRFLHLIRPFTENAEQQTVVNYLRKYYPDILFTTGLLGIRLPEWACWLLRALGYKDGTPDLMVFAPNKFYHGLFIEMKRKKYICVEGNKKKTIPAGKATKYQEDFIEKLNNNYYYARIAYGAEEAINIINFYFNQ